jgi:hypothetical protein
MNSNNIFQFMQLLRFDNKGVAKEIVDAYKTALELSSNFPPETVRISVLYHNVLETKWGIDHIIGRDGFSKNIRDTFEFDIRGQSNDIIFEKIENFIIDPQLGYNHDGLIKGVVVDTFRRNYFSTDLASMTGYSFQLFADWTKDDYKEYDILVAMERAVVAFQLVPKLRNELEDLRKEKRKREEIEKKIEEEKPLKNVKSINEEDDLMWPPQVPVPIPIHLTTEEIAAQKQSVSLSPPTQLPNVTIVPSGSFVRPSQFDLYAKGQETPE